MTNSASNFVKMIKEICGEENIDLKSFSHDWVFRLQKNGVNRYLIGYQFGLNTASVDAVCCDKSAASEIMSSLDIPNVEHYFFMSPAEQQYIGAAGNWDSLLQKLKEHGRLVCKPNEGTGGNLVFCVGSPYELENAVYRIFQESRSMAVSPYYDISGEYRVIVLDGNIKLIYEKKRPCVVGDGIHPLRSLIFEYLSGGARSMVDFDFSGRDMDRVLDRGECFALNWKHNLGQGARARILQDQAVASRVEPLVRAVVDRMNVRFASIDVVECSHTYRILEINSGVMMEYFSRQDEDSYHIAKEIYREAVLKMFQPG